MFEKFFDFIEENREVNISSMEDFMNQYNGRTFLNGLYRFHKISDIKNGQIL